MSVATRRHKPYTGSTPIGHTFLNQLTTNATGEAVEVVFLGRESGMVAAIAPGRTTHSESRRMMVLGSALRAVEHVVRAPTEDPATVVDKNDDELDVRDQVVRVKILDGPDADETRRTLTAAIWSVQTVSA